MQRRRMLPKTSIWKQLRRLEFGMAETPCTDPVIDRVKSFKSVGGRDTSATRKNQCSVPSLVSAPCFFAIVRCIDLHQSPHSEQPHSDGTSSGLLHEF